MEVIEQPDDVMPKEKNNYYVNAIYKVTLFLFSSEPKYEI